MTAEDARAVTLAATLARDWQMVGTHLACASSVDPARGLAESALVAPSSLLAALAPSADGQV